jgi:hypothetical protein
MTEQPTGPTIVRAEIAKYPSAVEDAIQDVIDQETEIEAPIWTVFNRIIVHVPPELGREDLYDQFNRELARFGSRWAREFHRRYAAFLTEDEAEQPGPDDAA